MLHRLIGYFGLCPRSLRRRNARLGLGPSPGSEEAWLDAQAVRRCLGEYKAAFAQRYAGCVEVQSSDNASYYKQVSPTLTFGMRQELSHQTAIGSMFLAHQLGCARPDLVAELSRRVPCWIVPDAGHGCWSFCAVAQKERGAECAFPPDGQRLPTTRESRTEWQRVSKLFVEYDGTLHGAAKVASGYLNFTDAPAPCTHVDETQVIMLALNERLRLEIHRAQLLHGALDDVSTPALPTRKTVTAVMRNGKVVTEMTGLRTHSQEVYPAMWEADRKRLRTAKLLPLPPLPFNSLSKPGQLSVQLQLQEVALDQSRFPGWYNKCPEGDGNRTFYQGDGGSENVMHSNYRTGIKRIWQAMLTVDDGIAFQRHYRPFASRSEARDHIDALRKLLVHDALPAPMHNTMIIGKSILVPHVAIGECVPPAPRLVPPPPRPRRCPA